MESINHRVTVQPQRKFPRVEPPPGVKLYPGDLQLSYAQYMMITAGSAASSIVISRPIYNLQQFSFLFWVPAFISPEQKQIKAQMTLFHYKPFAYPISVVEQFCQYFAVFALNSVLMERVETFWGREKKVRIEKAQNRRYKTTNSSGHTIPGLHTDHNLRWVWDGFVSGAMTGFAYTLLAHPFDVLKHATDAPDAPKIFKSRYDVFKTMVQHRPQNIPGLYKGFSVAAMANTSKFSLIFGLFHAWKYELCEYHPLTFLAVAQATCFIGELAHYPFHKMRTLIVSENAKRRFSTVTAREILRDLRRRSGVTMIYDGFFQSRPGFAAVAWATMLTVYDHGARYLWENVKKGGGDNSVANVELMKKKLPHLN